jgi:hypothetical protein
MSLMHWRKACETFEMPTPWVESKEAGMIFKLTAVCISTALLSCSRSNSSEQVNNQGNLAEKPDILKALKPISNGLTFYFFPFAASQKGAVYLERKGFETVPAGAYSWGVPKTVSGYHWPWNMSADFLPASAERLDDSGAKGLEYVSLESLLNQKVVFEDQKIYRFFPDPKGEVRARWPAVVGRWDPTGGVVSPLFLSVLRPVKLNEPVRVYFLDQNGKGLATASTLGNACGLGCYDADSYLKFLDVPVAFSKSGTVPLEFFGQSGGNAEAKKVRFVLPQGVEVPVFKTLRESKVLDIVAQNFQLLNAQVSEIGAQFDFQTIFTTGCGYQGLEHPTSALLSFGLGCTGATESKSDTSTFLNLALHEMIHAWNGKWIFSQETAAIDFTKFDPNRNRQLFFYEGFTEGLARLLLANGVNTTETREHLLKIWNATASDLQKSLGTNESIEEISLRSVSLGYALGAWLALEHSVQSRILNFDMSSLTSENTLFLAKESLSVLKSLFEGFVNSDRAFWRQFEFKKFVVQRLRPDGTSKLSVGYQSVEIATAVMKGSTAFQQDPLSLANSLQKNRFLSLDEFEARFRRIALVLGREVLLEKGVLKFGNAVPLEDKKVWFPF